MSQTLNTKIAVVGIDIGKNSFHIVVQSAQADPAAARRAVEERAGRAFVRAPRLPQPKRGVRGWRKRKAS
jgi:hypothetical protein